MRTTPLAVLALLLAAPLLALAPAAQADAGCWKGDPDCPPGALFCTYRVQVCVRDPCFECMTPAEESFRCVTVYDFPDAGYKLCFTPFDPNCRVYEERTTFIGTERRCIVPPENAS